MERFRPRFRGQGRRHRRQPGSAAQRLAVDLDSAVRLHPRLMTPSSVRVALPALGTTFIGAALAAHASRLTPPWQRVLGVAGGGLLLAAGVANLAIADESERWVCRLAPSSRNCRGERLELLQQVLS